MSARRARLAAVKAAPAPEPPRFADDPARVYPDSAHLQRAYAAAVAWMRRDGGSRWVLDQTAAAPGWRCNPTTGDKQ